MDELGVTMPGIREVNRAKAAPDGSETSSGSRLFMLVAQLGRDADAGAAALSARRRELPDDNHAERDTARIEEVIRTLTHDPLVGYLVDLEDSIGRLERKSGGSGISREEMRAVRARLEEEATWLVGRYSGHVRDHVKRAASLETVSEFDAVMKSLLDNLIKVPFGAIYSGEALERRLALELDRDPLIEFGVEDRYVAPDDFRVKDLGDIVTLSFRFDDDEINRSLLEIRGEIESAPYFDPGKQPVLALGKQKSRLVLVVYYDEDTQYLYRLEEDPKDKKLAGALRELGEKLEGAPKPGRAHIHVDPFKPVPTVSLFVRWTEHNRKEVLKVVVPIFNEAREKHEKNGTQLRDEA